MENLSGRVALITGGSLGIGLAAAMAMGRACAVVAICSFVTGADIKVDGGLVAQAVVVLPETR